MSTSGGSDLSRAVLWVALIASAAATLWAGFLFLKSLLSISYQNASVVLVFAAGIVIVQLVWNRLLPLDR